MNFLTSVASNFCNSPRLRVINLYYVKLFIGLHISNMEKAEIFVQDMTYSEFTDDEKTCYAVMRCIEIMGEAVKHIPMDIRQRYSQIPWRDMAGMRDGDSFLFWCKFWKDLVGGKRRHT
ncbi:MAG: HepT-like ribonuclease domain-containing protein [bacterium]